MYVREDYADAIRFLYEGAVKVAGFITQRYPFEKVKDAFDFIDKNPSDVVKAVLMMGKP
jgi:threonine dehydrogenase-like Zn-dependent dehydrogenase